MSRKKLIDSNAKPSAEADALASMKNGRIVRKSAQQPLSKSKERQQLLRVPEVAEILHCSTGLVWTMIYERKIESVIIGSRGRRVPLSAIEDLVERGTIPALR